MNEQLLRALVPQVIGVLVRRGTDFATAEDAVQDALLEAHRTWSERAPDDPKGWLVRVAQRRLVDAHRSETARRRREETVAVEPPPGPTEHGDDTLLLLFLCCHPSLTPASAVALTLPAVGGLTTREIAEAFLVPEATMAQRISRAKRTLAGRDLTTPGDLALVLRVLYLIFNEGYGGRVDLAAEAIRLTRVLVLESDEPEVAGLLALMLLHHARRDARRDAQGRLVTLDEQDRSLWHTDEIAEGVRWVSAALARERPGEYQVQAAIAALHDDAPSAAETDWVQLLAWYDDLVGLTGDNPLVALNRAVVVGQVDGPLAGLRALESLEEPLRGHHRLDAVRGHLLERAGRTEEAVTAYVAAAHGTASTAERDHLTRRAASLRAR